MFSLFPLSLFHFHLHILLLLFIHHLLFSAIGANFKTGWVSLEVRLVQVSFKSYSIFLALLLLEKALLSTTSLP